MVACEWQKAQTLGTACYLAMHPAIGTNEAVQASFTRHSQGHLVGILGMILAMSLQNKAEFHNAAGGCNRDVL